MGFFTPRRCANSCKCKPGCACEIRLTFEPRIGSLHCQFNVDIELFRVCDGVETELDPADYDIQARFESSFDGVMWTTEIESNANTVKFVLLDFRGASGYYYRLTAWEGAGSTGEDCAEGIDEVVLNYTEDRICVPDEDDCCLVNSMTVNLTVPSGACCASGAGGTKVLNPGLTNFSFDIDDGPLFGTNIPMPCAWSYSHVEDWDCNGTGACATADLGTHWRYTYNYWVIEAFLTAGGILVDARASSFYVTVAKFPAPFTCEVTFDRLRWFSSFGRSTCSSGEMELGNFIPVDCVGVSVGTVTIT